MHFFLGTADMVYNECAGGREDISDDNGGYFSGDIWRDSRGDFSGDFREDFIGDIKATIAHILVIMG